MRFISAIVLLLIISSCAHNKIRFVRTAPRQIVQVDQEQIENQKFEEAEDEYIASVHPETEEEITVEILDNSQEQEDVEFEATENQTQKKRRRFSSKGLPDKKDPKMSQQAYDEALTAERDAKRSKNSFISAFLLMLIPIAGIILSITFFGIGWTYLNKSNSARFITARGDIYEESARRLWIAYMIFVAAIILLIAVAIIL